MVTESAICLELVRLKGWIGLRGASLRIVKLRPKVGNLHINPRKCFACASLARIAVGLQAVQFQGGLAGSGDQLALCLEVVLLEASDDFPFGSVIGGNDAAALVAPTHGSLVEPGYRGCHS